MKRLFTFLLLLNFSSLAQNVDLKKGLVVDYPIIHGKTFDISINSNHGLIEGNPTFVSDRFGNPNGAIKFNGLNDAFSAKNSSSINILNKTNAIAISAWIYIEDFGQKGVFPILTKVTNFSKNGISFEIDSLGFVLLIDGIPAFIFEFSLVEFKKKWHHIVINLVLRNEIEGSFYLDEKGGTFNSEYKTSLSNSGVDLYFGKVKKMNENIPEVIWANGMMDNIKIYNRILNENEVKALFELDDNSLKLQSKYAISTIDSLMLAYQKIIQENIVSKTEQLPKNKTQLDAINEIKGSMLELPMDRNDFKSDNSVNRGVTEIESGSDNFEVGKYYALIIGNNDYEDPELVDLDNPISDAKNLFNVIINNYNFELPDLKLLENGTHEQITEALDYFRKTVKPEDNFLIFYAGHGYWDLKNKLGYWLPIDAKKINTARWISNSNIQDYMKTINSKHTLLITDACFSGSIFKTRAAFADAQKSIIKLHELTSKKAMTSGSLKPVPDESVFLKFLIKKLTDNKDDYLPSNKLFTSLNESVMNNSDTTPLYGVIQDSGDDGGEFIFIKRK